jgi:hypothetical protein
MLEDFRVDTTRDLVDLCAPEPDSEMAGQALPFCEGYIVGTGQLYRELVRAGGIPEWACADPAPSLSEIREAFVSWARAHPDQLDGKAVDGFWRAMSERWPCK